MIVPVCFPWCSGGVLVSLALPVFIDKVLLVLMRLSLPFLPLCFRVRPYNLFRLFLRCFSWLRLLRVDLVCSCVRRITTLTSLERTTFSINIDIPYGFTVTTSLAFSLPGTLETYAAGTIL